MKTRLMACFALMTPWLAAGESVRSGQAAASWLAESPHVKAGAIFRTVVRVTVDPEWHVYWVNPGDSGMPTRAAFKLPEGWSAGEFQHPLPERFLTGELHGYGHGGVVDYAIEFKVPEGFAGNALLKADVSWLTCNNESCVAGEAALELSVKEGAIAAANVDAAAVKKAFAGLPVVAGGHGLRLEDMGDHWAATVENSKELGVDLVNAVVWVETPELVAASAEVKFRKVGDRWVAQFPKSPYAPKKLEKFEMLLVSEKGDASVRLRWNASPRP